jgi:hypothetical protein
LDKRHRSACPIVGTGFAIALRPNRSAAERADRVVNEMLGWTVGDI